MAVVLIACMVEILFRMTSSENFIIKFENTNSNPAIILLPSVLESVKEKQFFKQKYEFNW